MYEFRGFGVMRANYSVSQDTLVVELPGPQLGKQLHEARVPIASITGFAVAGPVGFQGTTVGTAMQAAAINAMTAVQRTGGQLLMSWTEAGRKRKKAWTMLNVADPMFGALVAELARLRPDADLRAMPIADAKRKMGMWSDQLKALAFIAGVLGLIGLFAAYHAIAGP